MSRNSRPQLSWREIAEMTWVTFQVLAIPIGMIIITVGLVVAVFWALATHVLLATIPIGLAALGLWYLARRDKREKDALEREVEMLGRRRP